MQGLDLVVRCCSGLLQLGVDCCSLALQLSAVRLRCSTELKLSVVVKCSNRCLYCAGVECSGAVQCGAVRYSAARCGAVLDPSTSKARRVKVLLRFSYLEILLLSHILTISHSDILCPTFSQSLTVISCIL